MQEEFEILFGESEEGYANAFLIKFKDLSVSDEIEWYNSIGTHPAWNYKYITAITYHEKKTD